ncbi:MAG: PhoX family phosphatase [Deltaproteobacteria bacterium]|nr:PhoX family phosphatase [Deltaproteobacteria bacterium]
MNDTDDVGSNLTDNPHLAEIIEKRMSRRKVLAGGLGGASVGFFAGCGEVAEGSDGDEGEGVEQTEQALSGSLLGFEEISASQDDTIRVPPGYRADVIVPWGTPLFPDAPEFAEDGSNTAADQARQVGFNHDGMHYFAYSDELKNRVGVLVINHEYTDASQIYTAAQGSVITPDAAGVEKVDKALAGHGVTVVKVAKQSDGSWIHINNSDFNRRVTGTTPMDFSGPVGPAHPMLVSSITPRPLGTLNNCAHGFTPWGTYLACEENWNGYFGTDAANWTPTPLEARYGVSRTGFGYNWHKASPRFDLNVNRSEANHFGWVVEIDPFSPSSTPVKRTALGRFKHEGATVVQSRGRVVVYSGDDENGDYLYKFVGNAPWRKLRARGMSPLDHGTLYVAKFEANGTGSWLPLVHNVGPLTVANGWLDDADVLIRTRMAADAVGATRLHRPEWVAVHPKTKELFVCLTNGSGNAAPVNSGRDPNPYGHIVKFSEGHDDISFIWDLFLLAGDPSLDSTIPSGQSAFGSPDGLWIDKSGRVWIQTDISNSSQNRVDRGYGNIGNNAMLAADPDTGEVRRFLTGPRGCEITGVITTPDQKTMFVNVQHPGESTTYWNGLLGAPSTANPSAVSSWPYGGRPRPATVVIRKLDGGKIGT